MKSLIKKALAAIGIRNKYDNHRFRKFSELNRKIEQHTSFSNDSSAVIVIFSKDRAMQLDALLRSYFHFCKNTIPVYILYHASAEEFKNGYKELISSYKDKNVEFNEEQSFRNDLVRVFDRISASKILFLVDDLVFKNPLDLNTFTSIDTKKYVASLRMGKHLSFAYTLQKEQGLPKFNKSKKYPDMMSWSYRNSELDWAYPLSVDGHLFDFNELKIIVGELEFKAPNSFEEALQLMNPLFENRVGLCYEESIIVNNPCNKVQLENNNISGEMTIEELNNKWLSGYRIEFEKYKGILNNSAHQELTLEFVKR
ncbi:MAG: hypothetical protein JKY48_03615 [Flavobacteriales bacterium]|nr:hypothetical protein [Flavobacteriales bacterium]